MSTNMLTAYLQLSIVIIVSVSPNIIHHMHSPNE
jgi:hypothetical protein